MIAQHTPGPWSRLDRPDNALEDARILTHITNGAHIICTLGSTCTDGSPAHSANSSLISSAPDLLSALEEMLGDAETMNPPFRNDAICERARAAIAKAKGEA